MRRRNRVERLTGRGGLAAWRGFALVAVMWMLAALALLVAGLMGAARTEIRSLQGAQEVARAAALGDAAIQVVLQSLQTSGDRPTRMARHEVVFDGVAIAVRILPAEGFVDLNVAEEGLLAQLFTFAGGVDPGLAETLAQAVGEWRTHGPAAEPAGMAGGRGRTGFDSIEDLLQVPGFDFMLFDRIRDLVTIVSGATGVDPLAASPEVLFVLASGNRDAAASISARRDTGDPVIDMTSLTHAQPNSAGGTLYRLDALTPSSEKVRHVRSAWVSLAGEAEGMPWQILEVMPVRALGRSGSFDGE